MKRKRYTVEAIVATVKQHEKVNQCPIFVAS